jgi:hypothetical protein
MPRYSYEFDNKLFDALLTELRTMPFEPGIHWESDIPSRGIWVGTTLGLSTVENYLTDNFWTSAERWADSHGVDVCCMDGSGVYIVESLEE